MTIFNSQRVNNDPKPLNFTLEGTDWEARRPEYDNNPNPILVEFRERLDERGVIHFQDIWDATMLWLDWATPEDTFCWQNGISKGHLDHAQKVLTRLVNVYGDKEN